MRSKRALKLRPIDSTKNYVQFNTVVPTVSVVGTVIAMTAKPGDIDETDVAKTSYVEDGSKIRGFNIGLRVFNESGVADSNSTVIVLRKYENSTTVPPAVPAVPGLATFNSLGTAPFKNRIFHAEQAITGSQVSGWPMGFPSIKIPNRFHTMKMYDYWILYVANNTGNNLRVCGLAMYKWYK